MSVALSAIKQSGPYCGVLPLTVLINIVNKQGPKNRDFLRN